MSRSGYSDDYDCSSWDLLKYRGQVASAVRGRRGQQLLGDLLDALESMPSKRLFDGVFDDGGDCMCALGAVGRLRGVQTSDIDPEDGDCAENIAGRLDVAWQLAAEVMSINDDDYSTRTPERRWRDVYSWALRQFRGPRLPFAPRPSSAFDGESGECLCCAISRRYGYGQWPDMCDSTDVHSQSTPGLATNRCADTGSPRKPVS